LVEGTTSDPMILYRQGYNYIILHYNNRDMIHVQITFHTNAIQYFVYEKVTLQIKNRTCKLRAARVHQKRRRMPGNSLHSNFRVFL
jgi:hypothetical protein